MKSLMKLLADERGMILVITLLILALLIGAGVGAIVSMQTDLRTSSNLKTGTMAFYIAEAGIERAKSEIGGNKTFNSALAGADGSKTNTSDNGILSFGSSVSFGGGTYAVTVTDNNDGDADTWDDSDRKVYITSTGKFPGGSTRVIKALVTKKISEDLNAINIIDDRCEFEFQGSGLIEGHDYTYNPQNQNNPTLTGPPDKNGMARSCTTNNDIYGNPNKRGDVQGVGGTTPNITSNVGSLTLSGLQSMRSDLISSADTTYSGSTNLSGVTLGTRSSPKITYVNDSLSINGNVDGVGILIVDKDFVISGNFTFEGIVLIGICNTCPGRFEVGTGNSKIYGAVILANPTFSHDQESRIKMTGNARVNYSSYALELAIRKTFKSLSWQDVSN